MKSDIRKIILQLLIILVSGTLASLLPLSYRIIVIDSDKILTSFDIAIYSATINIIVIFIEYFINKFKMQVKLYIKSVDQDSNELLLYDSDVENERQYDIVLGIRVTGRKRKNKKPLLIRCPESYICQISKNKSYHFVKETKTSEEYEIDLDTMLERSPDRNLSVSRDIHFSLLLEDHNKNYEDDLVIKENYWWNLVSIKSEGLKLIQK